MTTKHGSADPALDKITRITPSLGDLLAVPIAWAVAYRLSIKGAGGVTPG
jgi:hypothetical protein